MFLLLFCSTFFVRKFLKVWYRWTIETNNTRLVELLKLKKKILSKVQETETFNEARMILEKYDPQALRNMSMSLQNLSSIGQPPNRPQPSPNVVQTPQRSRSYTRPAPQPTPGQRSQPVMPSIAPGTQNQMPPMARTVRPILPPERSVVEKVVDYMFSDGPESRYALICFQCRRHNGMALQDEFEYMSYCCAYCGIFNPARKSRPQAPLMAIEPSKEPMVQEPEDVSTPKIVELDTVLNKTVSLFMNFWQF